MIKHVNDTHAFARDRPLTCHGVRGQPAGGQGRGRLPI
jgi:hypothetical protein